MKTVFIVNKAGHDFSAAEKYGQLVFLSDGTQNKFAVTGMYRKFAELLEFSKSEDYILLTGLSHMNAIACSMFAYKHGKLNLLLFKTNRYIERTIMMGQLITKGESDV